MIAEGFCIMARICHTNNCPVGVASAKEALRKRFYRPAGAVVNFLLYGPRRFASCSACWVSAAA